MKTAGLIIATLGCSAAIKVKVESFASSGDCTGAASTATTIDYGKCTPVGSDSQEITGTCTAAVLNRWTGRTDCTGARSIGAAFDYTATTATGQCVSSSSSMSSKSTCLVTGSQVTNIDWKLDASADNRANQEQSMFAGDSVKFSWAGDHDVYLMQSCGVGEGKQNWNDFACPSNNDGNTNLGGISPVSYTIPADYDTRAQGNYICFYCGKPGHCAGGMHLTVKIKGPPPCAFDDLNIPAGVTVASQYSMTCKPGGRLNSGVSSCNFNKDGKTCAMVACKDSKWETLYPCGIAPPSPAPWTQTTWTGELPAFTYTAGTKCTAGKSAEPISTTKKASRISATSSCLSVTEGTSPTLQYIKQTCAAGDSSFVQQSSCDSEDCTTCRGTEMTYSIEKVGGDAFCITLPDNARSPLSFMSGSDAATTASDASAASTGAFAPCLSSQAVPGGSSALPLGLGLGLGIPAVAAAALMLRKRGAGAKPPASGAVEMGKSTAGVAADAASAL